MEKINRGENQIVVECMNKVMKSCQSSLIIIS